MKKVKNASKKSCVLRDFLGLSYSKLIVSGVITIVWFLFVILLFSNLKFECSTEFKEVCEEDYSSWLFVKNGFCSCVSLGGVFWQYFILFIFPFILTYLFYSFMVFVFYFSGKRFRGWKRGAVVSLSIPGFFFVLGFLIDLIVYQRFFGLGSLLFYIPTFPLMFFYSYFEFYLSLSEEVSFMFFVFLSFLFYFLLGVLLGIIFGKKK